MKRTRHQFAPAMPGQKVIDRAVAGSVPDGLLIGRLEIVDVQHLSGPGGLGEARQQGLLLGHRHVLALASAARLGLERLDPAVVIGHVRPVHRAQRDTHGRCNRRLRHPALAQQYHLDALTLHGGNFPAQRRLQLPDLGLAAFDHLFPLRIRWSERITPCSSKTIPFSRIRNQRKNPRFNQLWKRYKVYPMRSHTVAAEGGAAAVIKDEDHLDYHFHDTVSGGDWLCDQDAVELFVNMAPRELLQMEHWGCPWSREPSGKVAVRPFGGMKIERTWYAADQSGFHMLHTLFQTSLKYPSIRRFDEYYATDLLVENGRCSGTVAIEMRSGRMVAFQAKAVIIATGGCGRIFPFTTNGAIKTGDGMAMAYRAGVALKDMEFIQYHPTGLPGTGILMTEGSRGEGGLLINKDGYRYLQDYGLGPPDPWPRLKAMELGPRDRLSQAFWHEQRKGRTIRTPYGDAVLLDIRHLGEKKINERLPMVRELAQSYAGVDPVHQPIPVRPVVHYTMGGIHTDMDAATPLPGLFAAGECACVSINGANRLGSNSLTELLVFGARAGHGAAAFAKANPRVTASAAREGAQAAQTRIRELFTRERGSETVSGLRKAMHDTI